MDFLQMGHSQGKYPKRGKKRFCKKLSRIRRSFQSLSAADEIPDFPLISSSDVSRSNLSQSADRDRGGMVPRDSVLELKVIANEAASPSPT
jgi:hypothetical protein